MLVPDYNNTGVAVLLRQPGGGFAPDPASPVATGGQPLGIVAPDFDGDGRPDLGVANHASNTVSVLLRRGSGYEPDAGSPISLPAGPSGLATADVDGDGAPDLVATSDQANVLNVLLNRIPRSSPSGPVTETLIAQLRPPSVVGVAASRMEVAGTGGKLSSTMKQALREADLEARLRSAAASSRVEVQVKKQQAAYDPAAERRLDSLVYGIPVEVRGMVGQVVEVAAAIAIASRNDAGRARVAVVELPPVAAELQQQSTIVRLPVDGKAAKELQRKGVDEAALTMIAKQVGETAAGKLDSLSEMESLRMQMAMDRASKMLSTLSNLLKKAGETSSTIVGNLKRPSGKRPVSKAELLRRAGATANEANAAAYKAAALLAPVLRAHPTTAPRASFALKPCPKRCQYPRFAR